MVFQDGVLLSLGCVNRQEFGNVVIFGNAGKHLGAAGNFIGVPIIHQLQREMNGLVWFPFKHLGILQPAESLVGGPFRTGLYGSSLSARCMYGPA